MNTPKTIEELLKWLEKTIKDNNALDVVSASENLKNELSKYTKKIGDDIATMTSAGKDFNEIMKAIEGDQQNIINIQIAIEKSQERLNKKKAEQLRIEKEGDTILDKIKRKYNEINESTGNALTKIEKGFGEIKASGNKFLEPWAKADKAASAYAKSIGMSGTAMKELRYETLKFISSSDIAIKFNKSAEELLRIQQSTHQMPVMV